MVQINHMLERRVKVLPPEVANVIAAGEVVERPASVVKELVENSLDAGASEILIHLEKAGREEIRIIDNGFGMSAEEAQLALERHATSKISSADDLMKIASLGFRGEALPSIAAVSDFILLTRMADSKLGCEVRNKIEVSGAKLSIREIAAPIGTSVTVSNLFSRFPARQKFMRGERSEFGHVQDIVTRMAISRPDVRFILTHGNRKSLQCVFSGSLDQRLAEIFGSELLNQTKTIAHEGLISISGCLGLPALARPTTAGIYSFVNGRPIRDRMVQHAIMEGYRTYIPKGEYPFIVLQIYIPPDLVDVNVHPAKAEVRFREPQAVHGAIVNLIRKELQQHHGLENIISESPEIPRENQNISVNREWPSAHESKNALDLFAPISNNTPSNISNYSDSLESKSKFKPIGQIASTYLLYEAPGGGLLIVDQHAAHERIGFEQFKSQWKSGGVEQQRLLDPLVFDLPPNEAAVLLEHKDQLKSFGLEIDDFGGDSIAVSSIPALLDSSRVEKVIRSVAHELSTIGSNDAGEAVADHVLMTMACHRQIRAGDQIPNVVSEKILSEMQNELSMDRCPHGRPTWVHFSKHELEKRFYRK